jgi:uncharacterized protein (TIGR02611 family)
MTTTIKTGQDGWILAKGRSFRENPPKRRGADGFTDGLCKYQGRLTIRPLCATLSSTLDDSCYADLSICGETPALRRAYYLWVLMLLRTVEQVRRVFLVIAGFTLLLAGVVMLVTPGPGLVVILLGLSLLAAEFVWARRLMTRLKREGQRVRYAVWRPQRNAPVKEPAESDEFTPS